MCSFSNFVSCACLCSSLLTSLENRSQKVNCVSSFTSAAALAGREPQRTPLYLALVLLSPPLTVIKLRMARIVMETQVVRRLMAGNRSIARSPRSRVRVCLGGVSQAQLRKGFKFGGSSTLQCKSTTLKRFQSSQVKRGLSKKNMVHSLLLQSRYKTAHNYYSEKKERQADSDVLGAPLFFLLWSVPCLLSKRKEIKNL